MGLIQSKQSYCIYGIRFTEEESKAFATEYVKKHNIICADPREYIRKNIPDLNDNLMDNLDIMFLFASDRSDYNFYLCFDVRMLNPEKDYPLFEQQKEKFINWCSFYSSLNDLNHGSHVIQIYD